MRFIKNKDITTDITSAIRKHHHTLSTSPVFERKYAVGYFAKNQKFTEIKPKKMKANTQDSTIIFTKFNNIESLIRKSKKIENIIIKKEKNLEK